MAHPLRGRAAIVGVGVGGLGEAPGRTSLDILSEAVVHALGDAGLTLGDVDGLFPGTGAHFTPSLDVAEYLGIRPRFSDGSMTGGSSFVAHLLPAAMALEFGLCRVALVCYGSNQKTAGGKLVTLSRNSPYEEPFRPRYPITAYALAAARHMHEFGTTRAQLAEIAVAARKWAALNPEATMRAPLSLEDVLKARPICDPLGLLDCCLVSDGGGAVILVRAERARDFPKPPVHVLGCAHAHWHRNITAMPELVRTAASESGPRALAMAGCKPADIDLVMLYDAFTITTLLFLEDLGFCPKGEGGRFVEGGAIAPGGRLAVNTNGGGLSAYHPGMYGIFLLIEAVRQLRGEAGERQLAQPRLALCHANGGVLSSQVTAVLGTAETL
ncbi:MAG: thiolase [Proteobacteria bacterium]|nr:thiolase [Pseudomonadota bacterium]